MVNPKSLVLSSGIQHGLEYSYPFINEVGLNAQQAGNTAELGFYPEELEDLINKVDPAIFYGCGHGNVCIYTVECMSPFVAVPYTGPEYTCPTELRPTIFKGKHVHLLSCLTARYLGPELVSTYGTKSFIGYIEEFWFGAKTPSTWPDPPPGTLPDEHTDFYTMFDADRAGIQAILNGGTPSDAIRAMINKFEYYIWRYTYGDWKDYVNASTAIWCLEHDLRILRLYGNSSWIPLAAYTPPTLISSVPAFASAFALSFGLVGLVMPKPSLKPPKKGERR